MVRNSKKKIGIITIQSFNFGNRLQNYALQQVLKSMGFRVETIQRKYNDQSKISPIKRFIQNIMQTKAAKFRAFDKLIYKSKFVCSANIVPEGMSCFYEFFVAGSDQIWNPIYKFTGSVDFLCFADINQKIAYAASFGVSSLPNEIKKTYIEYLKDFKQISFREYSGVKIYKELMGRDADVVLDPTMLLTAQEWRKVEKRVNVKSSNYVLIYSLGKRSDEFQSKINELSSKYEMIDIRKKLKNGHEWAIGPSEFLYLIDNATLILTDSFHGTVFSIIFRRQFIVFKRVGMDGESRIETLLSLLKLNRLNQNYFEMDSRLNELRVSSKRFLQNSLLIGMT